MFVCGGKPEYHLECPTHGDVGLASSFIEASKLFDLEMKFCPTCGSHVKCVKLEIANIDCSCGICNKPVNNSWKFCIFCGEKAT